MSELVGNFLRHRALRHFSKHWEPTCKRCVASPKFSGKFSTRSSSFEALEIFSNEFLTSLLLVHFFFFRHIIRCEGAELSSGHFATYNYFRTTCVSPSCTFFHGHQNYRVTHGYSYFCTQRRRKKKCLSLSFRYFSEMPSRGVVFLGSHVNPRNAVVT